MMSRGIVPVRRFVSWDMNDHAPTDVGARGAVSSPMGARLCAPTSIVKKWETMTLVVFALLVFVMPVVGQGAATVTIIAPPQPVEGEEVELQAVVQNAGGLTAADLTAANFSVSEPFASMTVSAEASRPIALAVIVTLNAGSDADLIRESLRVYFSSYYRQDDLVKFYIVDGEDFRVVSGTDADQINEVIESLSASSGYYQINPALNAALDSLIQTDSNYSKQALYIGSYLNERSESNTPRIFASVQIPFHVVQAHRFRENSTIDHRAMATNGGGLFANNQRGVSVVDGLAVNTLKLLYDTLAEGRVVYTVRYRTTNPDLNAEQTVSLNVSLKDSQQASADFTYERIFQPPVVEILSTELNPLRMPFRNGEAINFDRLEQPIHVRVTFPDKVVRRVTTLGLEVLDTRADSVTQSVQITDPPTDGLGGYTLVWTLGDYSTPETTTPVRITVTATDELGLSANASTEGSVTVGALPPLPTVPPTLAPTAVPTAMPTPVPASSSVLNDGATPVLTIAFVILLLIVLYLFAALRRTRQNAVQAQETIEVMREEAIQQPAAPLPPVAAPPPTNGNQPTVEKTVYGKLVVIEGLEDLEIPIDHERFVIGRSENGCDYRIDAPFISPRHCEFTFRNGNFRLRDMGTKNGTFVNGERVPLERDVAVPIGSEIGITKNIKVELWDPRKVIDFDQKRTDRKQEIQLATKTRTHGNELDFPGLPGIHYIDDDEGDVEDDYSPT